MMCDATAGKSQTGERTTGNPIFISRARKLVVRITVVYILYNIRPKQYNHSHASS